jgi:hypothetical protein
MIPRLSTRPTFGIRTIKFHSQRRTRQWRRFPVYQNKMYRARHLTRDSVLTSFIQHSPYSTARITHLSKYSSKLARADRRARAETTRQAHDRRARYRCFTNSTIVSKCDTVTHASKRSSAFSTFNIFIVVFAHNSN